MAKRNPTGHIDRIARYGWLLLGFICVALGVIGALLPLMPTTIFLILATGCFARSSQKLEQWLLTHPRFGAPIRMWREHKVIPRKAKIAASAGIIIGFLIFCLSAHPGWRLATATAAVMFGCLLWIVTRKSIVGMTRHDR
ncbi:YbaN family protein [Pseudonocardia sp. TMWB2A]|uniref:YbaN family protein n=1 Tax=Pseudonocardia sp. TMWB2A TaxID=687430 RepID=UPI00307EFEF5